MKRPKSLPSRRQRALRRGVVLAVFLLAFLAIHRPSITPGQVIRASENLLGLERTEVLAQAEVLSHRVTFSAKPGRPAPHRVPAPPPPVLLHGVGQRPAPWVAQRPHGSSPSHPLCAPLLGQ